MMAGSSRSSAAELRAAADRAEALETEEAVKAAEMAEFRAALDVPWVLMGYCRLCDCSADKVHMLGKRHKKYANALPPHHPESWLDEWADLPPDWEQWWQAQQLSSGHAALTASATKARGTQPSVGTQPSRQITMSDMHRRLRVLEKVWEKAFPSQMLADMHSQSRSPPPQGRWSDSGCSPPRSRSPPPRHGRHPYADADDDVGRESAREARDRRRFAATVSQPMMCFPKSSNSAQRGGR